MGSLWPGMSILAKIMATVILWQFYGLNVTAASECEQIITKDRRHIVQWLATGKSASGCEQMTANDR